jgi:heat shock protein HslJ/uncharacterized membrane protein
MILKALGMMALVAAASTQGLAASAAETLTARGNEPFWTLSLSETGVTFELLGGAQRFEAPSVERSVVDGRPQITARQGGETLVMKVTERLCADTMSGMPFPIGVEVALGGKTYTGCGGEIMTAIEGGWRAIRLGNDELPADVIVTVVFGRDGQVSGKSGCNNFSGPYTLSGEGLSFGGLAQTKMACPSPAMEVEQRVSEMLSRITRVTPGENGQLRLMIGDEQAMVLDRAL